MSTFRKAARFKTPARIALMGPSGCGKSLGAKLIAYGLVGDWSKIAVIDTEGGSGDIEVGMKVPQPDDPGFTVGEYGIVTFNPPHSHTAYMDHINAAIREGFEAVIIDSLSHSWIGEGGLLEANTATAKRSFGGNGMMAWSKTTPEYRRLVDAVVHCPIHVISTLRTKTVYEETEGAGGKKKYQKIGTSAIHREGTEYEFHVGMMLDMDHTAVTDKTRGGLLEGFCGRITVNTGRDVKAWLEAGVEDTREAVPPPLPVSSPSSTPEPEELLAKKAHLTALVAECDDVDDLKKLWSHHKPEAMRLDWGKTFDELVKERKAEILAYGSDEGVVS